MVLYLFVQNHGGYVAVAVIKVFEIFSFKIGMLIFTVSVVVDLFKNIHHTCDISNT